MRSHSIFLGAVLGLFVASATACAAPTSDVTEDGSEALSGSTADSARAKKPFARGEGSAAIVAALTGGTFAGNLNEGDGDGTIFANVVLNANGTFAAKAGRPSEFFHNERFDEKGRWGIEAFSVDTGTGTVVRHSLVLNTATHGVTQYDFNADPAADGSGFVLNDQPVQQQFDRIFVF